MRSVVVLWFVFYASTALGEDVTEKVKRNTDLDGTIASVCEGGKCGNRGWSRLDSIHVLNCNTVDCDVTAKATVKYHEHIEPPKVFGEPVGGGIGIEKTIEVNASGILNIGSCTLTITKVDVSSDVLDLSKNASNQEGKSHYINNCKDLI